MRHSPDQRETERQDRHHHVNGQFEHDVELGEPRRQDHEGDADDTTRARPRRLSARSFTASPEKAAGDALRQQADQDDRSGQQSHLANTGVVTKVAIC